MKKSNQVMLTAAFVAAIASYSARAQELRHDAASGDMMNKNPPAEDSSARKYAHTNAPEAHVAHERRGFRGWFRRNRNTQPGHQNNGFGNTALNTNSKAHS